MFASMRSRVILAPKNINFFCSSAMPLGDGGRRGEHLHAGVASPMPLGDGGRPGEGEARGDGRLPGETSGIRGLAALEAIVVVSIASTTTTGVGTAASSAISPWLPAGAAELVLAPAEGVEAHQPPNRSSS